MQHTKLQALADGLTNGQPADVVSLRDRLTKLLSTSAYNAADTAKGKNTLLAVKQYLEGTPAQEIAHHASIVQQLHDVISTLRQDIVPDISAGQDLFGESFIH